MKIEVNQKEFHQCINTVRKGVSTKTTLPILSGILLKTEGDQLKLIGTDLEIGIESFVDANIIEGGEIVLPANYFGNIIKELPNDMVRMEVNQSNNTAFIKCGHSKFNINGFAADEFPTLPEIESGYSFSIAQSKFKDIINQVEFAISQDESKPFLNGGLLLLEEGEIKLVATDTYRLSYCHSPLEDQEVKLESIIPAKTIKELSRLLDHSEEELEIIITDNQILFSFSGIIMISRLIEGQFPNYKYVIPNKSSIQAKADKENLLRAIKRAALLARQDANIIKLNFAQDELVITANAPEVGQAFERVGISLSGDETEIAFNANYLIDALKAVDNEEVTLELSGPLAPGVVKSQSGDYICVIMPVRSA